MKKHSSKQRDYKPIGKINSSIYTDII